MASRSTSERSNSSSPSPYEVKKYAIVHQEIARAQRSQPVLAETLMLIDVLRAQNKTPASFTIDIEDILGMMQFKKRRLWLCPWGFQDIDEMHRSASSDWPAVVTAKFLKLEDGSYRGTFLGQRFSELRLMQDDQTQIDRVFLYEMSNFDCLDGLKRHGVEELHITYGGPLRKKDIEAIARCPTLRVVTMDSVQIKKNIRKHLKLLKNLDVFFYDVEYDAGKQIEELRWFPRLKSLAAHSFREEEAFNEETTRQLIEIIKERKNTLENLDISGINITGGLYHALAACTNIRSLTIDNRSMNDDEIANFLSIPSIQATLEYVSLFWSNAGAETCAALARFKRLKRLIIGVTGIYTDQLAGILRGCARTIRDVDAKSCLIDEGILDAIAECVYLERIDLRGCNEIDIDAVEKYKRDRRPNYNAISYD